MRVLIIGASGYVGRCLCTTLSKSYQVFGTFYRNQVSFDGERICVDIRDEDAVQNLVEQIRPDIIFHLAWDLNDLEGCIVKGTKNLLRARNEHCSTSRFIFISTDAVLVGNGDVEMGTLALCDFLVKDVPEDIVETRISCFARNDKFRRLFTKSSKYEQFN